LTPELAQHPGWTAYDSEPPELDGVGSDREPLVKTDRLVEIAQKITVTP
jgi:hypothetical protein